MKYENGLFIFRRDLRIVDNRGLSLLSSNCKNVHTIFIFTPEQVTSKNHYKSINAIQFMIDSLEDLSEQIKKEGGSLHCFYGENKKVIKQLCTDLSIDYLAFNSDYTPYALQRDQEIKELCDTMKIVCESAGDYYLNEPGSILNGTGGPYQKFTPYYNTAKHIPVSAPATKKKIRFSSSNRVFSNTISLGDAFHKLVKNRNELVSHGGRTVGLKSLSASVKSQKKYSETRNMLSKETSRMSAYIKFGCISIREMYKAFKGNTELIRQVYWRDFYANILFFFPHDLGKPMKPSYNKIKWNHNEKWLQAWTRGETGFPVIDAAMRELNHTGYMHNRGRLIVAAFLTKNLLIDWREGERYFATQLVDYDPASNNGNWQWVASTGADSQPYFRIINPWLQSKAVDPDAEYIKKWVPELADVPAKAIHEWHEFHKDFPGIYFKPICDYSVQREKVIKMYAAVFAK